MPAKGRGQTDVHDAMENNTKIGLLMEKDAFLEKSVHYHSVLMVFLSFS